MFITMAGNLVALLRNLSHSFRVTIGNPAEEEERGPHPVTIENCQDFGHANLEAGRIFVPSGSINDMLESGDVEIVLHIKRKGILQRKLPSSSNRRR